MKLTVTRKRHSRREFVEKDGKRTKRTVTYEKGQSFDGTERELKQFGDRLAQVSAPAAAAPAEKSKADLKAEAEELGIEVSDRWTKAQIADAIEKAGQDGDELTREELEEYAAALEIEVTDEMDVDQIRAEINKAEGK